MRWAVRGRYNITKSLSWLAGGGGSAAEWFVGLHYRKNWLPMDAGMGADWNLGLPSAMLSGGRSVHPNVIGTMGHQNESDLVSNPPR